MTNTRSQRTKNREKTEETQINTQQPQQQKQDGKERLQPYNPNRGRPSTNQQLNLQKKLYRQRCEDLQQKQDGKASTRPTNSGGKASAPSELHPTTLAAKHPPEQYSGKVTANRRSTRSGRCRGTKQGQAQKRILSEKSNRPSPARASKTTPPGRERCKKRRRRPTSMV